MSMNVPHSPSCSLFAEANRLSPTLGGSVGMFALRVPAIIPSSLHHPRGGMQLTHGTDTGEVRLGGRDDQPIYTYADTRLYERTRIYTYHPIIPFLEKNRNKGSYERDETGRLG